MGSQSVFCLFTVTCMMNRLSSLLLFFCFFGFISATTIDIDGVEEEEDGDARTVFTSGGTYYIALNTTYLLYYSLIAGALLLAGLALSGAFSGEATTSGYGQQYGYGGYNQRTGGQGDYRKKREAFSSEFTDQLQILAEAFSKYDVRETECQMYVACESAFTNKHEKHGKLAKTVFQVMQNVDRPENLALYQNDPYLMDIMQGYRMGVSGQSCSHLRKVCRQQKIFLDQ